MKRIIYISFLVLACTSFSSCKKYLSLDPPSDLSGNNFWKTKADVENFTNGMYELLRKSVVRTNMKLGAGNNEFAFFPFAGDLRGAPVVATNTGGITRAYVGYLANNNIKQFLQPYSGNNWLTIFNLVRFTQWDRFYQVIAAANIAYARIDGVPDASLTEAEKKSYKAEAVFLRNICYFFMVRMYGDVPYYTNPYNTEALSRMPMVEVLKNCAADMKAVKNDLPWTYSDPVYVSVRAMKGSALALLMHINMWLASFDSGNSNTYYTEVDALGDELQNQNGGAYALLPLDRSGEIFKGRSKEGLFEIPQNANYGETFGWSTFFDLVAYNAPEDGIFGGHAKSQIAYEPKFMEALYPKGQPDGRATTWFDPNPIYLYSGNENFRMRKFLVSLNKGSLDIGAFDASFTVFRYSDAILLRAEALAELGQDAKARQMVNIIRARAGAPDLTESGEELKYQLFLERSRELLGEGHYWYDAVRTRKIIDNNYKFGYHCTVDQYKAGAWTWPIDRAALINNPKIVLNTYWQ